MKRKSVDGARTAVLFKCGPRAGAQFWGLIVECVWPGLLATHFRLPHADSWCRSAVLRYGAPPRGTLDSNWTRIGVVVVVVVAVAVGVRLTGQPANLA